MVASAAVNCAYDSNLVHGGRKSLRSVNTAGVMQDVAIIPSTPALSIADRNTRRVHRLPIPRRLNASCVSGSQAHCSKKTNWFVDRRSIVETLKPVACAIQDGSNSATVQYNDKAKSQGVDLCSAN